MDFDSESCNSCQGDLLQDFSKQQVGSATYFSIGFTRRAGFVGFNRVPRLGLRFEDIFRPVHILAISSLTGSSLTETCSAGELPRSFARAAVRAADTAAASRSLSSFSSRICFAYGTTFHLRPRFVGGLVVAVEVDAASVVDVASVLFTTCPAATRAFLILELSYLMAFCRWRVLLDIVMSGGSCD